MHLEYAPRNEPFNVLDETLRYKFTNLAVTSRQQFLPYVIWGKVMFLHLSVILFTGGGGWPTWTGVVADPPGEADPPGQFSLFGDV